ncbi:MAG: NlpC/P60 family protein [Eubacteriales bacterium]|nr:NlpC/P60 family protein [Eubacteriales bacterium]
MKKHLYIQIILLITLSLTSCTKNEDVKSENIFNKEANVNVDNMSIEEVLIKDEENLKQKSFNEILTQLQDVSNEKSPTNLNLAYDFSYDDYVNLMNKKASISNADRVNSKAGKIFENLMNYNIAFIYNAYEIANQRLYKNIYVEYLDGDGNKIDNFNSIKEIMSMANVFSYYHNINDEKAFFDYAFSLLQSSHIYEEKTSEIYYCDGCMNADGSMRREVNYESNCLYNTDLSNRIIATDSIIDFDFSNENNNEEVKVNTDTNIQKVGSLKRDFYTNDEIKKVSDSYIYDYCPGHKDISIKVTMIDLNDKNGLYSLDKYGNDPKYYNEYWLGWDIFKKEEVKELLNKDWYNLYGLSISTIVKREILTQDEINYYLRRLPKGINESRYKIIKTALESVGRIPYYWGGKPQSAGYSYNQFYKVMNPDYMGRIYKGLDCSGWIQWVIWTSLGEKVNYEGTVHYQTFGNRTRRTNLEPGDLIVRPYVDSHVMMFLEWAEDGQMVVIHENGSKNNVSVGTLDGYFTYYQKIPY